MSLEAAIQENTAAIKQLIAAMNPGASKPADVKEKAAAAPKPTAKSESAKSVSETATVSQDDVKRVTLDLAAKKGRDAAVALLKQYSAAKATEIKPEQWADFIKEAKQRLVA